MVENSNIEWTDHTFNPWVGCEKISPACDHCYAESWAKRVGRAPLWQGTRNRTTPQNWRQPLKWNAKAEDTRRMRVFCASLADVFDNAIDPQWRADLFELIRATPNLDWQLLTKRIGNAPRMLPSDWGKGYPNVWLGATVANQDEADRDVPKLIEVPAVTRFLSCEPLLGPIDFEGWWVEHADPRVHENILERIDWVIVGGESGAGARGMDIGWAGTLVAQCQAVEVPVFVKQLGARPFMSPGPMTWPTTDHKGGDMREWPEALRVRQFPV